MDKVELLLPAKNETNLRAAVNNGADAVYFGLNKFNTRLFAENFDENTVFGAVDYCHKRNVKAYITLNTLVKNNELNEFFRLVNIAYSAGADAIIVQDPCFVPLIKKNFPNLKIHLSTQATTTNSYSIPKEVERVILARELSLEEIRTISKEYKTEVFVHGALCFSYSGQCLFSSIAGGRSGNRGRCAQPCRRKYNNRYPISTMDLCLLEKIPELIKAGVAAFKIEGRMRSPLYVATAARIYRKYIDAYYNGKFSVDQADIDELKLAFNRNFTFGFGFADSVVDSRQPMNRGLYLGRFKHGGIKLKQDLKVGDGVGIWVKNSVVGYKVKIIIKNNEKVKEAFKNDIVEIDTLGAKTGDSVYKTSSAEIKLELGDEVKTVEPRIKKTEIILPKIQLKENPDKARLFVKVYDEKSALLADKAGADIIYYDILKDDCIDVKKKIKNARFFVYTPRILSDNEILDIADRVVKLKPDGVLVGNRGLLNLLKDYALHLDYSFNCFNDIDLEFYKGVPIISPELNLKEVSEFKNKNFIAFIHGDIVLMTSKQRITAPELVDEAGRHFRVRECHGKRQILNSAQLGLFNKSLQLLDAGIRYFYIDMQKDADKFVRIYHKILSGEKFDDRKIRRGYTTGHFNRGVM